MKAAILEMSPEALAKILGLPDGTEIVDIVWDDERVGVLMAKVYGVGWEVGEGQNIPHAAGNVETRYDEENEELTYRITWNFNGATGKR